MLISVPAIGCRHPVEPVPEMVFVPVVADRAQVVVGALGTLPPDPEDRLLTTRVAHRTVVFHTGGGYDQVDVLGMLATKLCQCFDGQQMVFNLHLYRNFDATKVLRERARPKNWEFFSKEESGPSKSQHRSIF